jgi:hypothetical protein
MCVGSYYDGATPNDLAHRRFQRPVERFVGQVCH